MVEMLPLIGQHCGSDALWKGTGPCAPPPAAARSPSSPSAGQLGRQQLGDLGGVKRRAFAEVVPRYEHVDCARLVQALPDAADQRRISACDVGRGGIDARLRL